MGKKVLTDSLRVKNLQTSGIPWLPQTFLRKHIANSDYIFNNKQQTIEQVRMIDKIKERE